jgi:hypothetical protein
MMRSLPALLLFFAVAIPAAAAEVYQAPAEFVQEAFGGEQPIAKAIWVTGDLKTRVKQVLGHSYRDLRVRYWVLGDRSAWILEEIGKVEPITLGVVVERGHIEEMKVLAYRESRGFEIRFPFFMDQYRGAEVDENTRLDREIDGISGATLSVRAATRLARLALVLDREVEQAGVTTQSKAP